MDHFRSPGQAQRLLSVHDQTVAVLRPKRNRLTAVSDRHARADAFGLWADYTVDLAA
jgi:putative transposase